MKLTNIFDLVYSNEISESQRNIILDTIIENSNPEDLFQTLTEANDTNEPLVDVIDLLVQSSVTEEALEEAIDIIFSEVDSIDSVTEAFKERTVRRAIFEREEAINELFGFGKSEERKGAENVAKVASRDVKRAQDALKRAQGKVKGAQSPIGMAGFNKIDKTEKSIKSAQTKLNKALAAQKQSQAELGELKQRERKESIDKLKGAAKSVWTRFKEGAKSLAGKAKDTAISVKNKAVETAGKAKESAKKGIAGAARKLADKLDPQEQPKVTISKSSTDKAKKHLEAAKVPVAESLVDLLGSTNISESSFMEIIEMIVNPKAVKKIEQDTKNNLDNVLSAMNDDLKAGKDTDPAKMNAAEKSASKLEKIQKKWSDISKNQ